ncbi:hypothetical protein Scep_028643 [Stephania cephalantha]|uniref:Uncharacterized protein n=1 Tax=Stephania cephalantha TaxID=152367 RepID=A0AAP0EAA8_9MAGN
MKKKNEVVGPGAARRHGAESKECLCGCHSARSSFVAYYGRCVGVIAPPQPVNPSFAYF